MQSPQMYELNEVSVKSESFNGLASKLTTKSLGHTDVYTEDFSDLADISSSEVPLDLQHFVSDHHFGDSIFPDIVDVQRASLLNGVASVCPSTVSTLSVHPATIRHNSSVSLSPVSHQHHHQSSDVVGGSVSDSAYSNSISSTYGQRNCNNGALIGALALKKETDLYTSRNSIFSGGFQPSSHSTNGNNYFSSYSSSGLANTGIRVPLNSSNCNFLSVTRNGKSSVPIKRSDRTSDEYRRRRERNNVAVRKSREKAKLRTLETEERVKYLSRENEGLQKRIEMLGKELNVLKTLFANVGVLPDQLQREINKQLGNPHVSATNSCNIAGMSNAAMSSRNLVSLASNVSDSL